MKATVPWAIMLFVFGITGLAYGTPLTIANGGFETGDFSGWSTSGYGGGSVVPTDAGYGATEGSYFADLYADSALFQNVSWNAGDSLSFDWNFKANDYMPFNDWSMFRVRDTSGGILFNLTLSNVSSVGNFGATGWDSYTYTFTSEGSGYVDFGVFNFADTYAPSQLSIDNVTTYDAPVPEPATLTILCLGLMSLAIRREYRETNR